MDKQIANGRVAVTPSLLEEIQDWSEMTGQKQHETLSWLIELAKERLAETRPDIMATYRNLQEYKTRGRFKVAI